MMVGGLLAIAHLFQDRLDLFFQTWQVSLRNFPYRREINAHVIMDQYIAQPRNTAPGDLIMPGPQVLG